MDGRSVTISCQRREKHLSFIEDEDQEDVDRKEEEEIGDVIDQS